MADAFEFNMPSDTAEQDSTVNNRCFKEAVCIDAYRVYDSCGDKDCLEDLNVYFTEAGQHMIDKAANVRIRDTDVLTVFIDLEPVPFHKGFYSVDMTFFFDVALDVFLAPAAMPVTVCGLSVFSKKVILYGSEGNVKIYTSDFALDDPDMQNTPVRNLPKASVQVARPIGLSARLCDKGQYCSPSCRIPESICKRFGGSFPSGTGEKSVLVSIGIFTIVQIERNVQMLIPTYDFCVPDKECMTSSDDPCEMFNRIDFPTNEFFPPRVTDLNPDDCGYSGGCGCTHKRKTQ